MISNTSLQVSEMERLIDKFEYLVDRFHKNVATQEEVRDLNQEWSNIKNDELLSDQNDNIQTIDDSWKALMAIKESEIPVNTVKVSLEAEWNNLLGRLQYTGVDAGTMQQIKDKWKYIQKMKVKNLGP